MLDGGDSTTPALEIPLPPLEFVDLELVARPVLHRPRGGGLSFRRLALGASVVVPLGPDAVTDETLRMHVRQQMNNRKFSLLVFAVNFYPDESEPILEASVGVLLEHDGATNTQHPVARSISPLRLGSPVISRDVIAIKANLSLVQPQIERSAERQAEEAYVIGVGEGLSDAAWSFKRTARHKLQGVHVLSLIAEIPNEGC